MSKKIDVVNNIDEAKKAADEALKPYGFRLCNANNVTIDSESGVLYVNCKIVALL